MRMGIDLPLKPKRWETRKDKGRQKGEEMFLTSVEQAQFEITFFSLFNFIKQVVSYPPATELWFTSL